MENKKIGFFKIGSFSHTNERVKEILIEQFPDHEVEMIDIWEDLLNIKHPMLWAHCFKEYFIDAARRKYSFIDSVYRTEYFFKTVKRLANKLIKERNYSFTFQTQSIFDVSLAGVPNFVYTDHTHLTNLYYPVFDKRRLYPQKWISLEKTIYHNATLNLTMSSHVSRSIEKHYHVNSKQIKNVFVGSNVTASLEAQAANTNTQRYHNKNILFVGVAWERKGGPQLLAAFNIAKKVVPDATLTIVGCSPDIDAPGCKIIGRVALEKVQKYYDSASVFCLPTRLEPFGIVFIEAMSNKLPVVASNIGAIPDFIDEGINGYTVDPEDINSLAQRLITLLSSPEKCMKLGTNGYTKVVEKYSWRATGNRIKAAITEVL